jgi:DHA1 family multidrug resistance protein-like MFS transporter
MDLVRDSTIGQFVNFLSGGRLLPYADQRPGYAIPSQFLPTSSRPVSVTLSPGVKTSDETKKEADSPSNAPVSNKRASTFSVIAIDVRPPSRISNGRPSVDQSAVYIPSQFMVPASESEIALAPIMEPTSAEESEELKKREVSSESLPIAVKRESVVLAPVNEGRGFPDTNLVGWDGENDPDNPRFVSVGAFFALVG